MRSSMCLALVFVLMHIVARAQSTDASSALQTQSANTTGTAGVLPKMMAKRDDMEAILRAEVERLHIQHEAAKVAYKSILDDLSHRGGSREGVDRLMEAHRAEMGAPEVLERCFGLLDLSRNKIIPEEPRQTRDSDRETSSVSKSIGSNSRPDGPLQALNALLELSSQKKE